MLRPRSFIQKHLQCYGCGHIHTIFRSHSRNHRAGHIKHFYCPTCRTITAHRELNEWDPPLYDARWMPVQEGSQPLGTVAECLDHLPTPCTGTALRERLRQWRGSLHTEDCITISPFDLMREQQCGATFLRCTDGWVILPFRTIQPDHGWEQYDLSRIYAIPPDPQIDALLLQAQQINQQLHLHVQHYWTAEEPKGAS